MRTGHAPLAERLRDLHPAHADMLLRQHARHLQHTQGNDSLPRIHIHDTAAGAYTERVTTTPLSGEVDSGRGATVVDSQENVNRNDIDTQKGDFSQIDG